MNAELRQAISSHTIRLLREARERQRISMNVLAEKAGLHHTTISLVERELRNPSLDTLIRIAAVLNVDLGATIQKATRIGLKSHRNPSAR